MFTNIHRTKRLIAFFTMLFVVISLNWNSLSFGSEQQAVVTGDYVNIRSGPSTSYSRIDLVYKNDKLTVLEKKNDWYKVKLSKGKIGWIAGWLVSINKTTVPAKSKVDWKTYERLGTVTGSTVNIRSGPSTGYSTLSQVTKGTQLGINEAKGDWYNVTLANGNKGWIAGWLIKVSTNPNYTAPDTKPGGSTPTTPKPPSRGDTGNNDSPSSKQNAIVTGTIVNVRTGAGTNYAKVTQVKQGDTYAVLATKDGWYKLQLPGNKEGWIAGWLVQINQVTSTDPEPSQNTTQIGVVTGTSVNIRKGPNTTYEQLAQVKKGDQLKILGEKDGWYKITTSNIKEGWIAGWLVEVKVNEKIIQISLSEKSGAPVLSLAGNNKLTYTVSEKANALEIVFQGKYKIEGLEKLKLIEPYKEIKVLDGETSKIYIDFTTKDSCQVILSQDKQVLSIICPGTTLKGKKIMLDPGHGGVDPGAVGPTGYREKEFNLNTALKLKEILELSGAEVVITRSNDANVSLFARSSKANTTQADIFVSIHANSFISSSANGTQTFYYAPSSSSKLYAQLVQRKKLAELVQNEMAKELQLKDRGIGQENFLVLRETNMPSILVEVAFISNSEEEKLLKLSEFQDKTAWSIANGIVQYFK